MYVCLCVCVLEREGEHEGEPQDLVLEELGNVSEFNAFYACDRA